MKLIDDLKSIKGHIWDAIAQIIFLLMLILVAKGYTITRGRLRKITVIKLIIFFSIYLIAYIVSFICAEVVSPFFLINTLGVRNQKKANNVIWPILDCTFFFINYFHRS